MNASVLSVDDLKSLSLKDLVQLQKNVGEAIEKRKVAERLELLNEFKAKATAHGFTLEDLLSTKIKKAPGQAKYRNPSDSTQTWTGQGRMPKWLVALVDSGKDLNDFKI